MKGYKVYMFANRDCVNCRSTLPFLVKGCEKHGTYVEEFDVTLYPELVEKWNLTQAPTTIAVSIEDETVLNRAEGAMTPSVIEEFLTKAEEALPKE